ncbi:hypothetical protein BHE74_00011068 [Ensete ventricosum]|nr:hypothetical protein BHE74_00011068 [Ensete ventricosum]RZR87563.1 hypothetical protein BHM03_00015012 [Ensete ventricosum]
MYLDSDSSSESESEDEVTIPKNAKCDKGDPEKLQREREEIERQQREVHFVKELLFSTGIEKVRLQAEAKAAEDARKRAEAAAAAEAKRKIELEREAARQALLKASSCVCLVRFFDSFEYLEMLGTVPAENEKHTGYSLDGIGGFRPGGSNPLERLGLFIKVDDEEEEDVEHESAPAKDVEEGEVD